jgi:hypothetical protein
MKKADLRKLIIILLGALLLLASAEVGWIFGFSPQSDVAIVEEEEELIVAPFFVRMDSLLIPVIRNNKVERHAMLTLMFEVGDNHGRHRVQNAVNRIRDAFVLDLNGYMRVVLTRPREDFLFFWRAASCGWQPVSSGPAWFARCWSSRWRSEKSSERLADRDGGGARLERFRFDWIHSGDYFARGSGPNGPHLRGRAGRPAGRLVAWSNSSRGGSALVELSRRVSAESSAGHPYGYRSAPHVASQE